MKIKDIHIDGFGVWSDLAVDSLPDGMTLFYGPNEAGKTTLMQFIRASFYGFTPDRRQRYLPPVYGGTPGGAMRVTGPGGGYQIRRRVHATDGDNAEQSVMGQLSVTGQDGLSQGQHRLAMLLGQIDEPIFTNVFAIGLRELQELSTLDDTSAADELYKLSSGLDRVSLVDVMRSLRSARGKLIDNRKDDPEAGRMATLVERREKLRDEVSQLTSRGRRWSELATQRRTQEQEVIALRGRLTEWEQEARCVEIASSVRDIWISRQDLNERIKRQEGGVSIPEDAPGQLIQLEAQLEERKEKIESVKKQRLELREKSAALPLTRRLVELQGRIEAASEQATWVEALEEQIAKLDSQIEKAKQELLSDAEKLGLDEQDRLNLVDGGRGSLPDLSRQTLTTLSAPARNVKEQLFQLQRARDESLKDKKDAETLANRLYESLDHAQANNLHEAIKVQGTTISTLRQRMQIEEHLDKTKRHFRDLEQESLDLATSEALPIERTFMLSVPFAFGGVAIVYGLCHFFGATSLVSEPNGNTAMISMLMGVLSLFVWYLGRERGDQSTALDLEDCDRQIDTLRRQVREIEAERDDIDSRLPSSTGTLEMRMREAEDLYNRLESLLPVYHGKQAAEERYKAARKRAAAAADGLKAARNQWKKTLQSLSLSESLSPSSIRKLSEGYETLQNSRRKVEGLEAEKELRRRELATLAKRIETLYLEALGPEADAPQVSLEDERRRDRDSERDSDRNRDRDRNDRDKKRRADEDRYSERSDSSRDSVLRTSSVQKLRKGPLEQLNHLHEELARQQHWIKRRRELKETDVQLKKQMLAHLRGVERIDGMRRSLWAKCGVATAEQFYQTVDAQTHLAEMRKESENQERQIRTMIGTQCSLEDVFRELEGAKPEDLKRRLDALTERMVQTEERISGLQTRQGELAQEMRMLAEDKRLSHAQLELECVERQLESLARRWQTLAMTSSLLEDVCATFEKERQPETLREASSFLASLTNGKYTRIWTPLGTNQLKIDGQEGKSLPIEVLSRGTREAVFIALRLALAAAYARRGVMLPLVLDDVLVNFDKTRAIHAARTLKHFAELGHQVLMFTCHDHIAEIFHDIDVQVRLLPAQGHPGVATILPPPEPQVAIQHVMMEPEEVEEEEEEAPEIEATYEEMESEEQEEEQEEEIEEEIEEESEPDPVPPPAPIVSPPRASAADGPRPLPVLVPRRPKPVMPPTPPVVEVTPTEEPDLDWVWYQKDQANEWFNDDEPAAAPPDVWQRPDTWWIDNLATTRSKG